MYKHKRALSMFICAIMALSVFAFVEAPTAQASDPNSSYSFSGIKIVGDMVNTNYGQGQLPRMRYGPLTISGTLFENGQRTSVDYAIALYNPHTDALTWISDWTWSDGTFELDFERGDMPRSFGNSRYSTGYTTHYYDVLEVYLLILDDNGEPFAEGFLGNIYYLVSVA